MGHPIPRISRPANNALDAAGVRTLEDVSRWTERDLLALHGMGAKGIRNLRAALAQASLSFADAPKRGG